jgi:2-dehydropantoate 2-reductase
MKKFTNRSSYYQGQDGLHYTEEGTASTTQYRSELFLKHSKKTQYSKKQLNYAIVGTGAIGGFYGALLQRLGLEVHFLLNNDYKHVSRYGLTIESKNENFTLPKVSAYSDARQISPCDVVIIALKTTQNHLLPKILPQILKDDGIVLVLQNGLGMEEDIAKIVGSDRVIGGICFTFNYKVAPGYIRHLDYGAITLADYAPKYKACGITDRMYRLASDFICANLSIHLAEDLLLARWQKLIFNIPFNGLSVVLDSTIEKSIDESHSRLLIEQLMQEVAAIAKAFDRNISDVYIQERFNQVAQMKHYLTSMKLDYERQKPLEVEALFGNPLRHALQLSVSVPQLTMLYLQLKFFDRSSGN